MPTILVVDDEAAIRHAFQRAFRGADISVLSASLAEEAVMRFQSAKPDVVVLDVHLPDSSGLETFLCLRALDNRVPIILITGHGTSELAIEAMKGGAFDYLLKPLELGELRKVVSQAIDSSRLMRTPAIIAADSEQTCEGDLLHGRCPAMQEVYKAIGRVACQNVTVLVLGESGTGKELVSRAIYQHSSRCGKPFLAINCAAIPEDLLESELFGSEKGAFTGADRQRIGKFEQCDGGTILLDEVGEMSLATQAKILRLLQDQEFQRVGGSELVRTDVRVIAATNADLEALVQQGKFRRDLFYRLNVFKIRMPPLRERGSDIQLLIDYYFSRFAREMGKVGVKVADEAIESLVGYQWPGNVRELQSVLKQAILSMKGSVLLREYLPSQIVSPSETSKAIRSLSEMSSLDSFVQSKIASGSESVLDEALSLIEQEVVLRVLSSTGGNQVQAARILGITRTSLRNKIRQYGIQIEKEVWSENAHDGR